MFIKKLPPLLIFPAEEAAKGGMGRPSLKTPETVAKICAAIRAHGHSDTHAAARAGISASAVSRWRQEDEEFAIQLDEARTDYVEARLEEIRALRKRDGSIDWRAQAWLLQVAAPEVYGTPSRRHSLAREKEERQRAEEKAKAENASVITPDELARLQQWRAYSLYTMNGMGEEEARWKAHFTHHPTPPPFPGSLAIAGAEIPPPMVLTREEQAQCADLARRREAALRGNEPADEAEDEQVAPGRGETLHEEEEVGTAAHGEVHSADSDAATSATSAKSVVKRHSDPTDGAVAFFQGFSRPRPEAPSAAEVRESGPMQNTTNVPESRPASGGEAGGAGAVRPKSNSEPLNYWGAPPPTEEHLAYLARLQAEQEQWRRERGLDPFGLPVNSANVPESRAEPVARGGEERLADRGMGVPKARRPLAGAARAAAEAKEWRRINQLMERDWERSTDRATAVAEEVSRDAVPGMWPGV
jgi:hypothetical protein